MFPQPYRPNGDVVTHRNKYRAPVGAPPETREYKWRSDAKLTRNQTLAAYRLHTEGGYSIRELGRLLWERYGYASPHSCSNSLSDLFNRLHRPARDRVEATVAASTTHGKGARGNKAAYKRWHRATYGPWPSDKHRERRKPDA